MNYINNKKDFYYYSLSLFHIGSILIGMILTSRIININLDNYSYHFQITGGLFFIPVVFFIQDISTEIYGYVNTRKMLNVSLFVFLLFVFQLWILSKFINSDATFRVVASTLPRHAFSFIISLLIGGTINNYILDKLKLAFDRKFLAIRFISSTAIGEDFFKLLRF
ncbi:VUT family protein [Legionella gresilensis]|uniref:VUT family protein n=1 Tax=Legionella gresilensis TaxID=91823 RepID=UPI001040E9A1|nr:VUT family protein [Legionella gresilensis]